MIGVLTASTTSGSVLGYDLGDLKNKEQRIQILGSEGVFMDARQIDRLNQNWTDAASLKEFKFISRAVADDLAKQFDSQASASDRIVRATGHIALSFSPEDRPRLQDNDFKIKLATEYMEQMGIVDTQWVITEHYDTHAPHLHIAYNRVKYDGTVIDSRNERYRSQKIAAEISQKYGLTPAGKTPRKEQSLTPEQQLYSQMRTLAREALQKSCTMEEFKNNLRKRGIELRLSEHSEQQKSYGISYAMGEISAKGSKLDRSTLSYAKVSTTLEQNLSTRQAQEQADIIKAAEEAKIQERIKERELISGYNSIVPPMCSEKVSLLTVKNKAYQLMKEVSDAGVTVSKETSVKFNELKTNWSDFNRLNQEGREAKEASGKIAAIGGMLMLLNPIIGLTVMFLAKVANDIRQSEIKAQKKQLLTKVESIRNEISQLQEQKAQLKIEKQERLQEYLDAKKMLKEYNEGLKTVDQTVHDIGIDILKEEFPFKDKGHVQYIIHGPYDASIFRAEEGVGTYRYVPTGRYHDYDREHKHEIKADYYEEARQALKDKVMFVTGDRGPRDFYEALLEEQKYGKYRVGDMRIHPDGKISFGQERVFGDPKLTDHSVPKIGEPVVQNPAPAVEKKTVQTVRATQQANITSKPNYEIVKEFTADYSRFRIKKEADGTYKLQQLKPDTHSPVVNGRYSRNAWFNKAKFTSFSEVQNDMGITCFKIKDFDTGNTRFINQYGYDLPSKQLQRLGLGNGKGMGGRSL